MEDKMEDNNIDIHQSEDEEEEAEEGVTSDSPIEGETVWEDATLIQAYDRAIDLAKKKLMNQQDEDEIEKADEKSSHKKTSRNSPKQKWTVGSPCTARYGLDGYYYQAEIKEILPNDMCIVEYLGYGNTETLKLSSLQPAKGKQFRALQIRQAKNWKKKNATEQKRSEPREEEPDQDEYYQFPGINFSSPFTSKQTNGHVSDEATGYLSSPPIPQLPLTRPSNEREALSSMLMSWYMSGYHTGYYDALARFKSNEKKE